MTARSARHAAEHRLLRLARWLTERLPEGLALAAGAGAGRVGGSVLRVRRSDVDRHLAVAFPEESDAWRRRVAAACYAHLGREIASILRARDWSPDRLRREVAFTGLEGLRDSVERDAGALLLTAHLGNWELAGAAIAASGVPIDAVGKGMANDLVARDLFEARARLGMGVIDMDDAPGAVLRALRRGRVVAMLVDQNAHRSDLFVPFFGRPAATARGAALLAARAEAPVFLGFCHRTESGTPRYEVGIRRADFRPSGDGEADAVTLMTEYASALEEAIAVSPHQYFWHHRRWRSRPPWEHGEHEEQAASGSVITSTNTRQRKLAP